MQVVTQSLKVPGACLRVHHTGPAIDNNRIVRDMNQQHRAAPAPGIGRCRTKWVVGFVILVIMGALPISDIMAQDNAIPSVSGISMFTAPASGDTYQRGDPIEIRVDFDRLVAITGTPQIQLTVGTQHAAVGLSSTAGPRSSTASLFFEYTVVAADSDSDGVSVAANAIRLDGGSIKAAADGTTDAGLTHSALSAGSGHKVDGSKNEVPAVSSVSFVGSPASGDTYELGETIELRVKFHRFVEHSGSPQVELTIGGQTALASFDHGQGRGGGITELYFEYEVQANDFDANGISIAADAIRLNGGFIRAASDSSLDADPTHAAVSDDATRKVDGAQVAAPAVTTVRFTGTPARGSAYQSGETIHLEVWFDRLVTVSGSPYVELTIGNQIRQATFVTHGVGVQGLGFEYTVQARDSDADGISVSANAIRLNGATITATDGSTAAVLTHPAVPADPTRKVGDGTAQTPTATNPAVSSIFFGSSPANGDSYQRGETIDVRVQFTRRVWATGSPRLALTIGSHTRAARYYGNHYGRTLSFRYTVQATDSDSDGIGIAAGALTLNGGSIASSDGAANAVLTHAAVAADAGHKVSGSQVTAPEVDRVSISSRPRGGTTYVLGESIVVEVRFSEPVTVTGSPRVALSVASATRGAGFVRSSDRTLWFRYRVQDADRDDNGIGVAAGALTLNGGTIRDRDRNPARLGLGSHAIANAAGHLVDAGLRDTTPPSVSSVAVTSTPQKGGTYVFGETVAIEVRFSEPVTVTGSPRLALTVGSAGRTAVYASSRLQVVRFHYVVAAGDRGALSVAGGALSLNGGTILDAADNAAVLSLGSAAGALGAGVNGVRKDEDPPAVRSVAFESTPPGGDTYERGDIVQVAVRFSEAVTVTGQPQLALAVGNAVRRAGFFSAEGDYVRFRYTVQEEDNDRDGVEVAAAGLSLNGGTITDAAGNSANLSLAAAALGSGDKVYGGAAQETVPTRAAVTSEPSSGDTYTRGESVDVEVEFNKEVTVSGRPVLELTIGSEPSSSTVVSGGNLAGARASVSSSVKRTAALVSSANERLVFRYVVQSSDGSAGARIIIPSDALRRSAGSITDATGARLDRTNLSLDTAEVVHGDLVDGSQSEPAAPRLVAVVSVPQADRTYRLGEHLLVDVQFDRGISVSGAPQLELAIDNSANAARRARFVSADHDTIRFRYDVQAGDRDADGIAIAAGALHLNGGSIRAAGGGGGGTRPATGRGHHPGGQGGRQHCREYAAGGGVGGDRVAAARRQLPVRGPGLGGSGLQRAGGGDGPPAIGAAHRLGQPDGEHGGPRAAGARGHRLHLHGAQRGPGRRGNRHSGGRPPAARRHDPRRSRQRRRPEQQRGAAGGGTGGPGRADRLQAAAPDCPIRPGHRPLRTADRGGGRRIRGREPRFRRDPGAGREPRRQRAAGGARLRGGRRAGPAILLRNRRRRPLALRGRRRRRAAALHRQRRGRRRHGGVPAHRDRDRDAGRPRRGGRPLGTHRDRADRRRRRGQPVHSAAADRGGGNRHAGRP